MPQPLVPFLFFLVIVFGSLAYLWTPANWMIEWFIERLRRKAGVDNESLERLRQEQRNAKRISAHSRIAEKDTFDLPSEIIGRFERYLAFSLTLAFGLEGSVITVLLAWMGAKLLANWQRQSGEGSALQDQIIRAHTIYRANNRNPVAWNRRIVWLVKPRSW